MKDGETLIIGAGPAGMACALELWKAGRRCVVVEKSDKVGGLARTLIFNEDSDLFRTDIGPHRFFSKNKYLYDLIQEILGPQWIQVNRLTRFYIDGKYYLYPLKLKNALKNIGSIGAFNICKDYFKQNIKNIIKKSDPSNFEEYAVGAFGRSLAELNLLNYTEKIWGLPCTQLSVDWADQRIKGLSFISAVFDMLNINSRGKARSLVDSFYYPEYGAGYFYEKIQEKIGNEVNFHFNSEPLRIEHDESGIESVTVKSSGGVISFNPENVVTTIPITELLPILDPFPSEKIFSISKKLKYRSQVYLFITLNKPNLFPDQWVYFPEKEVPFGRASEMKNFSSTMAPSDKTSLFLEFFCWEGDEIWKSSAEELLEISLPWLEKFGWVKKEDIRKTYLLRQSKVYPVYDLTYRGLVNEVLNYCDSIKNLFTIGRPGRFKYNNQDHSLEMGILAARSIIEEKRQNFDSIGSGKEYFEAGYTPISHEKN